MNSDSRIYVAGHTGMVGSGIVRRLRAEGCKNLLLADWSPTEGGLDLRHQPSVDAWFDANRPEYVFLAAAKVGGILANAMYPADFIYDNLSIQNNIIHASYKYGVKRLLFLGSSCIYPRECPQPIREEYFLTGQLETTNSAYALAKIAGIEMCRSYRQQHGCDFVAAMPTNLYGTNDNFNLKTSHVLPALIRKFHEAKVKGEKTVTVWGTGSPLREFLHVDDLADACVYLMRHYVPEAVETFDGKAVGCDGKVEGCGLRVEGSEGGGAEDGGPTEAGGPDTGTVGCVPRDPAKVARLVHVNVGTGVDQTIRQLAETIGRIVNPQAEIVFDTSKPDGTPRKLLDVSRLHALGWRHSITLKEGIRRTYEWYVANAQRFKS